MHLTDLQQFFRFLLQVIECFDENRHSQIRFVDVLQNDLQYDAFSLLLIKQTQYRVEKYHKIYLSNLNFCSNWLIQISKISSLLIKHFYEFHVQNGEESLLFQKNLNLILVKDLQKLMFYKNQCQIQNIDYKKEILWPFIQQQKNNITMVDFQRNNRILQTFNSVKRQQKRRLKSISYYSKVKNPFFGSLFEIVRVWQKEVKKRKLTSRSIFDSIDCRPKSHQPHQIIFPEFKQVDLVQKPLNPAKNVFRVRINSNCEKLKSNCPRSPQKPKIKQLNVFTKTINGRFEKQEKQMNMLRESNEKWCPCRRSATPKPIKVQKQQFQQDFCLTPWQMK